MCRGRLCVPVRRECPQRVRSTRGDACSTLQHTGVQRLLAYLGATQMQKQPQSHVPETSNVPETAASVQCSFKRQGQNMPRHSLLPAGECHTEREATTQDVCHQAASEMVQARIHTRQCERALTAGSRRRALMHCCSKPLTD